MNKLKNEVSPYLLQHKNNPVHWEAWNIDSLNRSINENKPIIISIGYAACHWCHVMEHESFEDNEVAEQMNLNFINIKIDREERPDLDMIYMEAIQKMGIRGGWPLNVFLMPNQKPFYGGTYFPKEKWLSILNSISKAYKFNRSELENSANEFSDCINDAHLNFDQINLSDNSNLVESIYQKIKAAMDPIFGGIKQAPKFPLPSLIDFLINLPNNTFLKYGVNELYNTQLQKMAQGGIYDQIEGGFSRYSVDSEWFCPHFEKMLYDNVQLIKTYSYAFGKTKNIFYEEVVINSINFLEAQLKGENGLYYSSLDADSEGEEGKYYTWTFNELISILPENHYQDFLNHFSITQKGNWENNKNILFKQSPDLNSKFSDQLNILKRRKTIRIRPNIDNKQILSWNSMMVSSLITAYNNLDNETYLISAKSIINEIEINFIKNDLYLHQVIFSSIPIIAFLDDMTLLTKAYVDLYITCGDEEYLTKADNCIVEILTHFKSTNTNSIFYNYYSNKSEKLIAEKFELNDSVMPSSNSILCECLMKMGFLNQKPQYTLRGKNMLAHILDSAQNNPLYYSNWLRLYCDYVEFPKAIVKYNTKNIQVDILKNANLPIEKAMIEYVPMSDNQSSFNLLLCVGERCFSPINSIKELKSQMKSII